MYSIAEKPGCRPSSIVLENQLMRRLLQFEFRIARWTLGTAREREEGWLAVEEDLRGIDDGSLLGADKSTKARRMDRAGVCNSPRMHKQTSGTAQRQNTKEKQQRSASKMPKLQRVRRHLFQQMRWLGQFSSLNYTSQPPALTHYEYQKNALRALQPGSVRRKVSNSEDGDRIR
jgi:hypothetical protein